MKYHAVSFGHKTLGFTSQKDALAMLSLLSKCVQLEMDCRYFAEHGERWTVKEIGEIGIKQLTLREAPKDKPVRRGRALPAPPAELQLGYSADGSSYDRHSGPF